ncbi:hypothetical protein ILYODFUR_024105 [Ilyodon furcidens]|uniref:Uncharacterized protein n=1 Tax=Ilyodon furcidens TaxID=33524 RepID=A0ABV0VGP7_9TELE
MNFTPFDQTSFRLAGQGCKRRCTYCGGISLEEAGRATGTAAFCFSLGQLRNGIIQVVLYCDLYVRSKP